MFASARAHDSFLAEFDIETPPFGCMKGLTRARRDKQATSERELSGRTVFSTGFRACPRPVALIAMWNCGLLQMVGGDSNSRVAKLLRRSGLNARDAGTDEFWR
jgi:hypothetical protein